MDNVGIVVESLDKAISFFTEIGLKLEGRATIEGEWAGRVTGLGSQCVEIAMMVTPDGHSRLELSRFTAGRAEIFRALRAENIGVNVHYIPVHLHPYYRDRFGYKGGEFPVAEAAYESLISLPMFHGMTDEDVTDVICAVEKVTQYYAT